MYTVCVRTAYVTEAPADVEGTVYIVPREICCVIFKFNSNSLFSLLQLYMLDGKLGGKNRTLLFPFFFFLPFLFLVGGRV